MKRFIALLFLSFFVSQINAAMMPVDLNLASSTVVASGHDHCQEATQASHHDGGNSSANPNASATHYCCAVIAIIISSPTFSVSKQVEDYWLSDSEQPISIITESIYKPPKNYL